jgi:hypothetical protein
MGIFSENPQVRAQAKKVEWKMQYQCQSREQAVWKRVQTQHVDKQALAWVQGKNQDFGE